MFWKLQDNILGKCDLDTMVRFIESTERFTQFTKVREFEREYAVWQGCRYCVFVNSGSSANLILLLAAKELQKWDVDAEIIVPALTWPTTVTPVMQMGLKPVFVDPNLDDFSFNYEQLEKKITDKTRAIFVAHLLGFPADIARIKSIIGHRPILLLEDTCEAQGATIDRVKVGNHGDGGTFSFYWGHHMTTIEGGMICTNNEEIYKLCVLKRSHGLARELPEKYHAEIKAVHPDIDFSFLFLTDGLNVRNTELNAVLGLSQLPKIDGFIEIRNRNYRRFLQICRQFPNDLITLDRPGISSFVLPFIFCDRARKTKFQHVIRESGIESRPLISGNLLRQPFLAKYYNAEDFKNADFLHTNAFYIGNNQFVDDARLDVLEKIMNQFFER
jgi:CDP-6-deoxy-D-xylo-4-hexulose-3-dehydrase